MVSLICSFPALPQMGVDISIHCSSSDNAKIHRISEEHQKNWSLMQGTVKIDGTPTQVCIMRGYGQEMVYNISRAPHELLLLWEMQCFFIIS